MENYQYHGKGFFAPVVEELKNVDIGIYGPIPFFDYLDKYGIPKVSAPHHISIDSLEVLSGPLRLNNSMVLRLGRGDFSVVKIQNKLNDFFLIDDQIFSETGELFKPKVKPNQLLVYQLLPKLTENSLVNLAFSTGLINYALELDDVSPIFPPATCSTTFTFEFQPHTSIDTKFIHNKGNVEIDSMFIEKRNGEDILFIIEAKSAGRHKSLAKHKLVYPLLGISERVPKNIKIIPVYLKVINLKDGIHFHIVECSYPDPRKRITAVDELVIENYKHIILPAQFLNI